MPRPNDGAMPFWPGWPARRRALDRAGSPIPVPLRKADEDLIGWDVPVTASNPFKLRHYFGDIILWCVRWYLRFPISFARHGFISADDSTCTSDDLPTSTP